jgi:hypothetical protein
MGARGSMPAGLVASTMLPETNGELDADQAGAEMNGQSRGGLPGGRRRRRRAAAGGKISGRKFQIPDSVFERLQLQAIKKRSNASAIVAEILNRELPQHKIATEE